MWLVRDSPEESFKSHVRGLEAVLDAVPLDEVRRFIEVLWDAFQHGRQVFIVGNGGSAATASHMACDLGKTIFGKAPVARTNRFRINSLTDNVAMMTAWANDVGYEHVFAEQLRNLGGAEDLLVVITASGNSPNVVAAARLARSLGMQSFGMLGFDGGEVKHWLDEHILIASDDYGYIEDAHLMLCHFATAWFRQAMDGDGARVGQRGAASMDLR